MELGPGGSCRRRTGAAIGIPLEGGSRQPRAGAPEPRAVRLHAELPPQDLETRGKRSRG